jgi:hypothetical protein
VRDRRHPQPVPLLHAHVRVCMMALGLHRARGGWLSLSDLSYDVQHIIPRMLVGLTMVLHALPCPPLLRTRACCVQAGVFGMTTRRAWPAFLLGLASWGSIYVGWGEALCLHACTFART